MAVAREGDRQGLPDAGARAGDHDEGQRLSRSLSHRCSLLPGFAYQAEPRHFRPAEPRWWRAAIPAVVPPERRHRPLLQQFKDGYVRSDNRILFLRVPAEAGTHLPGDETAELWVPAFAGARVFRG